MNTIIQTQNDQMYDRILEYVKKQKQASCFELMNNFNISYQDAVHFIDKLEENKIVGPPDVVGPRKLLRKRKQKV